MFKLSIDNLRNDAMAENPHEAIAEILGQVAEKLALRAAFQIAKDGGKLYDANGNAVGSWSLDIEPEEN